MVGDGGGSALSFNAGSSLTVKIQVNDGSQNAPTCLSQGETGETNNLNLKACTAAGGSCVAESWPPELDEAAFAAGIAAAGSRGGAR